MNSKYYKNVLKKRIGYLVLLVCVIAIGAILSSVSPYIFGKTIDTISIKNQSDFHIWITGYIVVLLMIQLFLTVETLIGQWVTITIENDIKKSLMESILYIKNRYLEQYEKGALLNRIEFDVETIAGYYIDLIGSILMIILNSLIAIYFIFQISIKLSLVAIVFLPFSFLVNYFFRNKIRMIGIKQKEINDQYLSYNGWIFININSLKAFSMEACKQYFNTKYVRLPDLLIDLETEWTDGNYKKVMAKYANPVVLILDEWLLLKPTNSEQRDIFELLHRRRKKSSTIFCSQYAFEEWYEQLGGGDSPLADAIIDRIAHDSYRINITSIDAEHDRYMWLPMIGVL